MSVERTTPGQTVAGSISAQSVVSHSDIDNNVLQRAAIKSGTDVF